MDVVVASAGTGGTISGVAKGIKKAHNPDCVVVGVDPVSRVLVRRNDLCSHMFTQVGSILAQPAALNEAGKGRPY